MNDYNSIDTNINENLHNGYGISVIGLLNSHTLPPYNQSSKLNEINMSVENVYINCDFCYTNSCNVYVLKNRNIVDYTNKGDEFSTNI